LSLPLAHVRESTSLAYYRQRADERFWSRQWAQTSLTDLLALANVSAVTRFLERHVQPGDRVLEGGCGLGQYVAHFQRQGVQIVGVDYSESALAAHRASFPESELCRADLTELPFHDRSFDAYISLGVIEHYDDCGSAILAEAHRVLADDGCLLLSTPYLNYSRRLLRTSIENRQAAIAAAGGDFYQYAFREDALEGILEEAGFRVHERSYYDPGRGLRDVRALRRGRSGTSRGGTGAPAALRPLPPRRGRLAHSLLYSRPSLRTFAHMQIVCATKQGPSARD
jgi:ubiquinone/menaquinone biosynthesis C-methylase UbiE